MTVKPFERPFEILLVEDSPMDTLLVKQALAKEEREINLVELKDGEQAIRYLRHTAGGSSRPNLVLLDLNLPKIDGWELLGECKLDPTLKTIPIVVFTTSQSNEEIQICYELGANSVVCKPTGLYPFLETVRSVEKYWRELSHR
jgi:chemotaxis family two-component system response regulator Rcp1